MADKRTTNRLTDRTIKSLAKLDAEQGRHADGGNLYFNVRGNSRGWVFFYRLSGRLREMSLGSYPEVSLASARQAATAARALSSNGVDPIEARRRAEGERQKAERAAAAIPTFGTYALALVDEIEVGFSNPKHRQQWRNTLITYCKPIWATPIDQVNAVGVLKCLRPIWTAKAETAIRLRGRIERVLDAAKAQHLRSGDNPAAWRGSLKSLLPMPDKASRGHHAALPYEEMAAFVAELRGQDVGAAMALELLILTATRTSETLNSRWDEFDLDAGLWTIPGERMKARKEHRVPLPARALEILRKLDKSRTGEYVFSGRRPQRPLSNMALLMLLRRMGRADLTGHGFRSSFSDWASEVSSFSAETRESALAHTIRNKVEAAYRRGDALEKRRAMMESWAQWCEPKGIDNVIQFNRGA
jgi:integrase